MKKIAPSPKVEEKRFLSRRGLSARWEVSQMFIRRLQQQGRLKVYYFGRDARYLVEDVEAIEKSALVA